MRACAHVFCTPTEPKSAEQQQKKKTESKKILLECKWLKSEVDSLFSRVVVFLLHFFFLSFFVSAEWKRQSFHARKYNSTNRKMVQDFHVRNISKLQPKTKRNTSKSTKSAENETNSCVNNRPHSTIHKNTKDFHFLRSLVLFKRRTRKMRKKARLFVVSCLVPFFSCNNFAGHSFFFAWHFVFFFNCALFLLSICVFVHRIYWQRRKKKCLGFSSFAQACDQPRSFECQLFSLFFSCLLLTNKRVQLPHAHSKKSDTKWSYAYHHKNKTQYEQQQKLANAIRFGRVFL